MVFQGVYTAVITPFINGEVDWGSLTKIVEAQLDAGINGIVACGTTGESATLSDEETLKVIAHVAEVSKGGCQVIAGVGSNSTQRTCDLIRRARELRISGALVITPYYNKPSQEGLLAHFKAVAHSVPDLPLMLYTVPGRTGVDLEVDTFAEACRIENVVALKDAAGDLSVSAEYVRASSDEVSVLSGDDITALPMWSLGGRGLVSVASNICPDLMMRLWRAHENRQVEDAKKLHLELVPYFRALFMESNPAPIKFAMAQVGLIQSSELRLPLVPVRTSTADVLAQMTDQLRSIGG